LVKYLPVSICRANLPLARTNKVRFLGGSVVSTHPEPDGNQPKRTPASPLLGITASLPLDVSVVKGRSGFTLAAIGGALALLAFFLLPFASLFFISATGAQVAQSGVGASGLLWLLPITALAAIGFSGRALLDTAGRSGTRKTTAIALLGLGGTGTLLLLIAFASAGEYARLVGGGFWIGLLGMLAVAGGGAMEYARSRT
jgi:hypothetical protein